MSSIQERVQALKDALRPAENLQPYHCEHCRDTSWVQHTCMLGERCERKECKQGLHGNHSYVSRCDCYHEGGNPRFRHLWEEKTSIIKRIRGVKVLGFF